MPERIYTSANDGALEALEETPFSSEDDFQVLIAEHPELLDGEQIRPGDARRWILITREKGIAETSGGTAKWAVDHLIIDQDAVPTLVEIKRGSNSEIRRTIVGQLLEYAAHASENWTVDELRDAFDNQAAAQGLDARDERLVSAEDRVPVHARAVPVRGVVDEADHLGLGARPAQHFPERRDARIVRSIDDHPLACGPAPPDELAHQPKR